MSDFTIRADSVDVEQIMRQIRSRIRDKRGVDYTEDQIRELAAAKLERFLDPTGVRSDLLEQFRNRPSLPPGFLYQFEDTTLFDSDKAIVRFFRRLLRPFLKLLFNPNVLSTTLHTQAAFNQYVHAHQPLQFELLHNLVLELTRTSIEVKTLKMRLESVQSRLEFNERRARALEAVVQYKPDAPGRGRGDRGESRGEGRGDGRREGRGDARGQQPQARPAPPASQGAPEPAPQPAPQPPPQPRPAPQAAPVATGDVEDPGTEPLGGVDPITGGESVRTRRRRRRRRRAQGGAPGEGGAQVDLRVGAIREQPGSADQKVGATEEQTSPADLKVGATEEQTSPADLKVGATGEQTSTWGTASAVPAGGDAEGRLKAGTTDAGDPEARLKAGTTDDPTRR